MELVPPPIRKDALRKSHFNPPGGAVLCLIRDSWNSSFRFSTACLFAENKLKTIIAGIARFCYG